MRPSAERRQFGRRTTSIQASIVVAGRPPQPCIVRNISAQGAFLELAPPKWMPFQFQLQLGTGQEPLLCEIRHAKNGGIGVNFIAPKQVEVVPAEPIDATEHEHWMGVNGSGALSGRIRK